MVWVINAWVSGVKGVIWVNNGFVDGKKIAPLESRRAKYYSMSKSSSSVILKFGNITSCKSSLFCSVTVL